MIAKRIAGANAFPSAPKNWNPETDGTCSRLAVRVTKQDDRVLFCQSAWEPTPQEMQMLMQGGQIVLTIVGWQVPVALSVEPAAEPIMGEKQSEQA